MLLLAFVLPVVLAFFILSRFWPSSQRLHSDMLLKLSLAGPLGLGVVSILFFVWILLFTPSGYSMVTSEIVLLSVTIVILIYNLRHKQHNCNNEKEKRPTVPIWLWIGFFVCMGLAMFTYYNHSFRAPHGHWDAWAIWNLKARFLFQSAEQWQNVFSTVILWSSPDYPLLLSGSIARTWKYLGNDSVVVPMIIAALFYLSTIGLTGSAVSRLTNRKNAILAGLCLVGTPFFISHASSQYADVPVAFFILAAMIFLTLYDHDLSKPTGYLILAGVMASLAAWTKNEGIVFLMAIILARGMAVILSDGFKICLSEMYKFFLGATPVLIVLLYLKFFLAPQNSFMDNLELAEIADKLTDLFRYKIVTYTFLKQMISFGNWMPMVMIVFALLSGFSYKGFNRKALISNLIVLGFMLAAFFFTYIITPETLEWHMRTSLNRVLLQMWPLTIFIYCSMLTIPDKD